MTTLNLHRVIIALTEALDFVGVADIFQALSQNRPYRDRLPPEEVLAHLQKLVGEQRIDGEIVALLAARLSTCYTLATA